MKIKLKYDLLNVLNGKRVPKVIKEFKILRA